MANNTLHRAKAQKNDEFYTQYNDIQKELNAYLDYNPDVFRNKTIFLPADDPEWSNFTKFFAQNFERFGLKKLISTSYAYESKNLNIPYQLTLFESESSKYDKTKTKSKGKIFILDKDENQSGKIDIEDLKWNYLKGDGDFRSEEVKKLRDEADIIVTNPPFSLFREFINWLFEEKKKFIIIGNQNAISYKEVFPLLKDNKMWLGNNSGGQTFRVPDSLKKNNTFIGEDGYKYAKFGNICWYTNIEHGRRHQKLNLMTMEDNIKFSKHKEIRGRQYSRYLNDDVIEVPYIDSIPADYKGMMGVPVTFMDKYNPEQFKIIGSVDANILPNNWKGIPQDFVDSYYKQGNTGSIREGNRLACFINDKGKAVVPFKRIIISLMEDNNENNIEN